MMGPRTLSDRHLEASPIYAQPRRQQREVCVAYGWGDLRESVIIVCGFLMAINARKVVWGRVPIRKVPYSILLPGDYCIDCYDGTKGFVRSAT